MHQPDLYAVVAVNTQKRYMRMRID